QHPFLVEREVKARLLVLVTADRGLAGGLNANAIRAANRFLRQDDKPAKLITVGRKGRDYFRRFAGGGLDVVADRSMYGDRPTLPDINAATTLAIAESPNGALDEASPPYPPPASPVSPLPPLEPL